jgi:hypothetical protein
LHNTMKLDPEIANGVTLFPALDLSDVNAARTIRARMREDANISRPTDDRVIEVEKTIFGTKDASNLPIRIYTPKRN